MMECACTDKSSETLTFAACGYHAEKINKAVDAEKRRVEYVVSKRIEVILHLIDDIYYTSGRSSDVALIESYLRRLV